MNPLLLTVTVALFTVSFHEPARREFAHSFEHTQGGRRVILRRGYPNENKDYSRTVRLTIVRDRMGQAVEVVLERDESFTIDRTATRRVYCEPREMHAAIEAFCRERYQPDRTIEIEHGGAVRRIWLSEMLNERRLMPECFHLPHREFSWTREAHELIVEEKQ